MQDLHARSTYQTQDTRDVDHAHYTGPTRPHDLL